jgi:pyrroloquinoline quinone (PQQ) biosynthesis protein C
VRAARAGVRAFDLVRGAPPFFTGANMLSTDAASLPTVKLSVAVGRVIDQTVADLLADQVFSTLFDGTASRELYLEYLTRTYHYVKRTSPLLSQAKNAMQKLADRAPVYKILADRFAEHEHEEAGHEFWLLDDIRAIGGDVAVAEAADPGPAVRAYGAMVDLVLCSNRPTGVLGFGTLLEGVSAKLGTRAANGMRAHSKIPNVSNALKFFDSHGEADAVHIVEANAVLDQITDAGDQRAILLCVETTGFHYLNLLASTPR